MGASKAKQFTQEENELSIVARALAHPARIAIVDHLKRNLTCRNVDLVSFLGLSKATVHQHILKLQDANLIDFRYMKSSSYEITLNTDSMEEFSDFVHQVTRD